MKKSVFTLVLLLAMLAPAPATQAANPWAAVIKAAIKRVVRAVDLLIQRRQTAVIRLQNAQKALENTMAKLHLDQITDWVRKQRDLYQQYYDELKKVKAVIAYYFRIKQVADKQALILEHYQKAWALFSSDTHFKASELLYMQQVYTGILAESAKNVDLLAMVVKSFTVQMTDVARLEIIEQAARQTDQVFDELESFNHENRLLSLSRAQSEQDARWIKALYGLP